MKSTKDAIETPRRRSWVALLLVFAVVAAACGSSREDSTAPADDGASETPATSDDDGTTEPTDDDGTTEPTDGDDATEPTDGGETDGTDTGGDVPMFGDQPWPCGPGDASGATEQGVTDDTIKIGAGDDRGFASAPGLNEAMGEAMVSMVNACNELGGINGRQIELTVYDAKIFEVSAAMLTACETEFMLVGEGFAVDGFGEETRVQCDLAHIPAWTVSAAAAHGPNMIQPIPNPADQLPTAFAAWFAETYPDTIALSGNMFGNFGATIETKDKVESAYPALGFEFIQSLEYNVNGEDDWTPFILQLKDAGVQHVYFSGSCLPNYQAARSAAAVNEFEAIWTTDANFYESACAEANTDGIMDNTFIRTAIIPFEERDAAPGIDSYLTLMEQDGNGISSVAVQSVSAFLMWATAASACGSELTRQCVIDNAEAIEEWDGHGSHATTNPGVNDAPDCGIVMELVGTTYERVHPPEPGTFDCDPSYVGRDLDHPALEDALLDGDRVSQQFTGG